MRADPYFEDYPQTMIALFEKWAVDLYPKRYVFPLLIAASVLVWPLVVYYPRENGNLPDWLLFSVVISLPLLIGSIGMVLLIAWFYPAPLPHSMNTNIPKKDLLKKEVKLGFVLIIFFLAINAFVQTAMALFSG